MWVAPTLQARTHDLWMLTNKIQAQHSLSIARLRLSGYVSGVEMPTASIRNRSSQMLWREKGREEEEQAGSCPSFWSIYANLTATTTAAIAADWTATPTGT